MTIKALTTTTLFALAAAALACPFCHVRTTGRFVGETQMVGNGAAYSWVDVDLQGKPVALGLALSETALNGLTDEVDRYGMGPEWRFKLPKEAVGFPLDHIAMGWNPKGHEPAGIYDVPHFDFHFYLLDVATRQQILPEPEALKKCETPLGAGTPEGYVMAPGTAVPWMGAHWVDPKSPELNGAKFTSTFIYGGWDGKLAFVEPMVAKSFLESKPSQTWDIAAPKTSWRPGLYPTKYTVKYDAARKEYQIVLSGFVQVGTE